jgi:hypothetical protein
MYENGINSEE